jgi:hypothetical protein
MYRIIVPVYDEYYPVNPKNYICTGKLPKRPPNSSRGLYHLRDPDIEPSFCLQLSVWEQGVVDGDFNENARYYSSW